MLTLYGMGGSQPSRAVWWACLIKKLPFTLVDVRLDQFGPEGPLAEFNPTGQVPTITDGEFPLYEMPAILCYLAVKHDWSDLYPEDLQTRAYIEQYLHFHHNRTRFIMAELMAPHVVVAFLDHMKGKGRDLLADRATHPDKLARGQAAVSDICRLIELGYFRGGTTYLCADQPSLADIACYEEVSQLTWANLFDFTPFPKITRWLDAMARLPHHEAAHMYNIALGDIQSEPNTMERFLGACAAAADALTGAGVDVRPLEG